MLFSVFGFSRKPVILYNVRALQSFFEPSQEESLNVYTFEITNLDPLYSNSQVEALLSDSISYSVYRVYNI